MSCQAGVPSKAQGIADPSHACTAVLDRLAGSDMVSASPAVEPWTP